MDTSDIIALLALLVSVVSMGWTWSTRRKLSKQQLALNEQQEQINNHLLSKNKEENEAKMKADIQAYVSGRMLGMAINIRNIGNAPARNIRLVSTDIQREDSGIIITPDELAPYPLLHPREEYNISVLLFSGHNPLPKVTLIWDDDFAKDNKKEQILQF